MYFMYLIVALLTLLAITFDLITSKKMSRRFENEVEKTHIFTELIETELKFKELCKSGMYDGYPNMCSSMEEAKDILRIIGVEINLDKISVVPAAIAMQDDEQRAIIEKIKEEHEHAPEELRALFKEKCLIVNRIGRLKHPCTSLLNRVHFHFGIKLIIAVLLVAIFVLETRDKLARFFNRKEFHRPEAVFDTYSEFA